MFYGHKDIKDMILFVILLCFTYYVWKTLKKRYPHCVINLEILIVSKTQTLGSEVQQRLFRWFPIIKKVQARNISHIQKSNLPSKMNSENRCNRKMKKNTKTDLMESENSTLQTVNNTVINTEMALILDDKVLVKLLCSVCGKYLSVFPIKVYKNDIVKCGRCCKGSDDGFISHFYENVAKSCLFKCINRYEHCNKLLTVHEIDEHERECISNYYDCPKCESNIFSGSSYELLCHYRDDHSNSILERSTFYIDNRAESIKERYLYIKNDIIFFILMEIINRENSGKSLYLSVISLTSHDGIKQQFHLKFLSEPVKRLQTNIKICSSLQTFNCDYFKIDMSSSVLVKIKCKVDIYIPEEINTLYQLPKLFKKPEETPVVCTSTQTLPLEQITGIEITDQFKQEYPDYKLTPCGTALFAPDAKRIELTCSECNFFTGCNVFSCLNGKHIMCWECSKTKQCKCKTGSGSWNANISAITELLLLPCRWNCGQRFLGDGLRNHEAECRYRR